MTSPPDPTLEAHAGIVDMRDVWQRPRRVVRVLGIRPGDTVADLGAGTGYFVRYLNDAVGPDGRVYAIERPPFDTALEAQRFGQGEHATPKVRILRQDVRLLDLPEPVDLLFACNLVHQLITAGAPPVSASSASLSAPRAELSAVIGRWSRGLKENGSIAIVDFRAREDHPVGPAPETLVDEEEVVLALQSAGYSVQSYAFLPHQYLLVARRSLVSLAFIDP